MLQTGIDCVSEVFLPLLMLKLTASYLSKEAVSYESKQQNHCCDQKAYFCTSQLLGKVVISNYSFKNK